ncbi:MAG: LysR family transcriptional regulator [Oceanospirillaceae bacterium]
MPFHHNSDYSIGKANSIDIRLLSIFMTVVECGGFTKAQEPLNIALSSISTYIQDLETRLGLKLCNRGRGGFSLTENGQHVYGEALKLFASVDQFNANLAGLNGKLIGELKIGILDNSTMSPSTRVPEVIHHFSAQHPEVHIVIKVLSSDEIEEELKVGTLHLGIGLFSDNKKNLRVIDSFTIMVDLYCGNRSLLFKTNMGNDGDSNEALAFDSKKLQSFGYAKGCYSPELKTELGQMLPHATASSYLSEGLAFLILSGRYVGFLPRRYAANWVSNKEMKRLPQAQFSHDVQLSVVVSKGVTIGPVLNGFLTSFASFTAETS